MNSILNNITQRQLWYYVKIHLLVSLKINNNFQLLGFEDMISIHYNLGNIQNTFQYAKPKKIHIMRVLNYKQTMLFVLMQILFDKIFV